VKEIIVKILQTISIEGVSQLNYALPFTYFFLGEIKEVKTS
jgi:hypothetical protein